MSAGTYLKNLIADHLHGKATWTPPDNIFVGFSTDEPLVDASGLAEPSGGDYARVSTAAADWAAAALGVTSNVNAVTFPTPTGPWGTVAWVVRFDAASGGNMIDYAPLPAPQIVDAGSTAPSFNPGTLIFTAT